MMNDNRKYRTTEQSFASKHHSPSLTENGTFLKKYRSRFLNKYKTNRKTEKKKKKIKSLGNFLIYLIN